MIEAFGQFVVGGNYVVGFVLFLALVAIQFLVVSHGAVRTAEVTARFTLDALPGKQMAIDADMNAGLIDEAEARRRRQAIAREAEFYGAMDGAARFNQRDSLATILITAINIVAGLLIGTLQQGVELGEAARTYTVLTVGDGLVTMIPSLLVSVAGGITLTRANSAGMLGGEIRQQLLAQACNAVYGQPGLGVHVPDSRTAEAGFPGCGCGAFCGRKTPGGTPFAASARRTDADREKESGECSTEVINTQGELNETDNPLDVAIQGAGFFQVQRPDGTIAYTRAGQFHLNNQGTVVTTDGDPLIPTITIPSNATAVTITQYGVVNATLAGQQNPSQLGQIQLATFPNPGGLESMGSNLLQATLSSGDPVLGNPGGTEGLGTLQQGYLENSNVDVVTEFVQMVLAQRAYESNSKVIKAADDMYSQVNNMTH